MVYDCFPDGIIIRSNGVIILTTARTSHRVRKRLLVLIWLLWGWRWTRGKEAVDRSWWYILIFAILGRWRRVRPNICFRVGP